MKIRYVLYCLLFVVLGAVQAPAQQTEAALELDKLYIEASKQKLIGNTDKAIELYQQILEEDEEAATAAFELARLFLLQDKPDDAIKLARQATVFDPSNEWYQRLLADVCQLTGRHQEAAAIFEQLAEQHPNEADYYYKWAFFLVQAQDIKGALRVYDALEKRIGITEELVRRKHTLYLGQGDAKRAGKELERLTEAFPDNIDFLHLLAGFHEEQNDKAAARNVYQRIIELDPNDTRANLGMAGQQTVGNSELAYLQSLQPIFSQADANIDLKVGKLLPVVEKVAETGDLKLANAALELSTIIEEVHPNQAKGYALSGDLLALSNQLEKAAEKYEAALKRDETVYLVWQQLLGIYYETQQFDKLQKTAEYGMDIYPNKADLYYMYGYAAQALGDPEDALSMLNQALLMSGRDELLQQGIISTIGMSYAKMEDPQEARDAFEKAVEINPDNPIVSARYAYYLAEQQKELDKAEMLAEKAYKTAATVPEVGQAYGRALFRKGKFKKAAEIFEATLASNGDYAPLILEQYGDVLFKTGENAKALEYWQKAQKRGKGSALLGKKIADKKLYE